jgi:hypothetical protein
VSLYRSITAVVTTALVTWCVCAAIAQTQPAPATSGTEPEPARLVGTWEVFQTKAPGELYKPSYRGQPFVSKGPGAFTLIMEYRPDMTFRRITRVGATETVQEGTWRLSGHELRFDRQGAREAEVMHIRFDTPDEYTSLDVYEGTPDPGLFGRFKRIK